jgi:16S rRNA (cytosine967-C5)-methyltransferase
VTPAARLQAAIELLEEIIGSAQRDGAAADTLIARYFKTRRYAGSKDRAAVREMVYTVLRSECVETALTARAAAIALAQHHMPAWLPLFDGSAHGPDIISDSDDITNGTTPSSALDVLAHGGVENAADELRALLTRAPLDIRVNISAIARDVAAAKLQADGIATKTCVFSPSGLRCVADKVNIETTRLFMDGLIDIQDEGSQLIALLARARPGETVVDLCAGAGGKTLALADAMQERPGSRAGRLIAHDIDAARLARLAPRAARAGLDGFIETRTDALTDMVGQADLVLVDAPCSGTGTWRRNPEARLRPVLATVARLQPVQRQLIAQAATLVRPGGRIVYAVCSLLDAEGLDHLATLPDGIAVQDWRTMWPAGQQVPPTASKQSDCLKLTPKQHGCDGFFIVCMQKL